MKRMKQCFFSFDNMVKKKKMEEGFFFIPSEQVVERRERTAE